MMEKNKQKTPNKNVILPLPEPEICIVRHSIVESVINAAPHDITLPRTEIYV